MGFVADTCGRIHSVRKLNIDLTGNFPVNRLLTGISRRYAILSKMTDSLMFLMNSADNTARVFSEGTPFGRYKNGKWVATDLDQFEKLLRDSATRKGILPEVVEKIGRVAIRMSDLNAGGLFVLFRDLTDMEDRYSNLLNGLSVSLAVESIRELTDEELVNFAKEDGAVLIDRAGNIHSFMAFLRPGNAFMFESDPSKGARHNVAKIVSKEIGCLCISTPRTGGSPHMRTENRFLFCRNSGWESTLILVTSPTSRKKCSRACRLGRPPVFPNRDELDPVGGPVLLFAGHLAGLAAPAEILPYRQSIRRHGFAFRSG